MIEVKKTKPVQYLVFLFIGIIQSLSLQKRCSSQSARLIGFQNEKSSANRSFVPELRSIVNAWIQAEVDAVIRNLFVLVQRSGRCADRKENGEPGNHELSKV